LIQFEIEEFFILIFINSLLSPNHSIKIASLVTNPNFSLVVASRI
jgi:hypothetical protein